MNVRAFPRLFVSVRIFVLHVRERFFYAYHRKSIEFKY